MIRFLLLALCVLAPLGAAAHEIRPAFLSIVQTAPDAFDVTWKVPERDGQRLALYARLPPGCTPNSDPARRIDAGALIEHWTETCQGGLRGGTIEIEGLAETLTDALLRIEYADGTTQMAHLTPDQPSVTITGPQSGWQVARTYFRLGVEHILAGFDHLAFVLALILLIRDRWMLVKTITAFTAAHSVTLAGASLGLFSLPQAPVEAAIALSIAFTAREIVLEGPDATRLSARMPWAVAIAFGLLHGFGFAGALRETGLPQSDVPLALLAFNLGVEAGQLLFIAAMLILFHLARRLWRGPAPDARRPLAYAVGGLSIFWLAERLASFAPWV